jgi:hypothetical protein
MRPQQVSKLIFKPKRHGEWLKFLSTTDQRKIKVVYKLKRVSSGDGCTSLGVDGVAAVALKRLACEKPLKMKGP